MGGAAAVDLRLRETEVYRHSGTTTGDDMCDSKLIQEYDPAWVLQFNTIKFVLIEALDALDVSVEHVGSTSVPGLAAKPIIDIDIVYRNLDDFQLLVERLSRIGYLHNGDQGIPGREAFKRSLHEPGGQPDSVLDTIRHHLYACHANGDELRRHILFRDYLRRHPDAREAYQRLKRQLAEETGQAHKAYAALKETRAREFILEMVRRAEAENRY